MTNYKIYFDEFENVIHKEKVYFNKKNIKNIEIIDEYLANNLFKEIFKYGLLDLSNFKKLKVIESNAFSSKNN